MKRQGKMAKGKEPVYRDFCLCEITHLSAEDFDNLPRKDYNNKLKALVEFGKLVIKNETKVGDLVMLETPRKVNIQHVHGDTPTEEKKEAWKKYSVEWALYPALAQFAQSIGRSIESIEPTPMKPGARFWKRVAIIKKGKKTKKIQEREEYLITQPREAVMLAKIQRRKPKLVIVASAHAAFLEEKLAPRKSIWENPKKGMVKLFHLRNREKLKQRYFRNKKRRRKRIIQKMGLKPLKPWRMRKI